MGPQSLPLQVFHLITLLPECPKILLNVESDDYGVLERRRCGCAVGEAGFDLHMHTIRNYEKLTSEGNQFLGSDLLTLLEQVLPAAFGGSPADYQLVERDRDGLPQVSLVVSPRVGPVDEGRLVAAVLQFLRSRSRGHRLMASFWEAAGTLEVERREPHATGASKILPLHLLRDSPG